VQENRPPLYARPTISQLHLITTPQPNDRQPGNTTKQTQTTRGLFEFGEYAFLAVYRDSFGMMFSSLTDPGNGMIVAFIILAAEWFVFMGLAWYLEQVFASGTGNRRHPLFFLDACRRVGGWGWGVCAGG